MEISNLNYFVERIVDLSSMNQVLCEQRREFEDKIEKLEEHISFLKLECAEKDARIDELESLEVFNTEENEEGYEYDEERGCEDCHTIPQPGGCACGRYEK